MNFTYLSDVEMISNGLGIRLLTLRELKNEEDSYFNMFIISEFNTDKGLSKERIIDQTGANPHSFNLFNPEKAKNNIIRLLETKIKPPRKKISSNKLEESYNKTIEYNRNIILYEDPRNENTEYINQITKVGQEYKDKLKEISLINPLFGNINLKGNKSNLKRISNLESKKKEGARQEIENNEPVIMIILIE